MKDSKLVSGKRQQEGGKDMTKSKDDNRFEELDGLRGLCACAVVACHFHLAFWGGFTRQPMLGCGPIAVYIFFALSGHVVAYRFLEDGKVESLLDSAFRRVPRLVLPMLWSSLIYWLLATHGAFHFEKDWRKARAQSIKHDDHWCQNCFPTDVGDVLESSLQVMWSFRVDHFAWLWTIPVEIFGAAVVFLLAPVSHTIVNFGIRAGGIDDIVRVGSLLWPTKLLRCLLAHGLLLSVVIVAGSLVTHYSDIPGPTGPLWRVIFLFGLGLASAQVRVLLSTPSKCGFSWTDAFLSKWNEKFQTKWLLPGSLILFGLGIATVPARQARNVVDFGPAMSIMQTNFDMYILGAAAIFVGVLLSPSKVRAFLSNFSYLGNISYSIYLVHMGVIWTFGLPLYVWLHGHFHPTIEFVLISVICAILVFLFSHGFCMAIEEPLGMWLPRYAIAWLKVSAVEHKKWLLRGTDWDVESKITKEAPKAVTSMSDMLEYAAVALEGIQA